MQSQSQLVWAISAMNSFSGKLEKSRFFVFWLDVCSLTEWRIMITNVGDNIPTGDIVIKSTD